MKPLYTAYTSFPEVLTLLMDYTKPRIFRFLEFDRLCYVLTVNVIKGALNTFLNIEKKNIGIKKVKPKNTVLRHDTGVANCRISLASG